MTTKAEVLRMLRFRDAVTKRDVELILDYVDQETGGGNPNAGKGALIRRGAAQSILENTPTNVVFSSTVYDDLGFFNPLFPNQLTIPATPTINRVQLVAQNVWSGNVLTDFQTTIQLNNGASLGGGIVSTPLGSIITQEQNPVLGPIDVVPGDDFQLDLLHVGSGGALNSARSELLILVIN